MIPAPTPPCSALGGPATRPDDVGGDARRPFIGRSPALLRAISRLEAAAPTSATVLIRGETGTGKEIAARFLHQHSPRAAGPFLAVNCAALPDALLESELFGHEKGAFTGAVNRRLGRFEAARGGTILLDEVGEMPPAAQAKLLRVLEARTVEPLGTNESRPIDVRVVAATHRDLRRRVTEGGFRADLYYRLNVVDVELPPLRDRQDDVLLLAEHFLTELTPAGHPRPSLSAPAALRLMSYDYPGNVRELRHALEHALVLCRGAEVDETHLPTNIAGEERVARGTRSTLVAMMRRLERIIIERTLAEQAGQRGDAAAALGISRKTLWEKMRLHGLSRDRRSQARQRGVVLSFPADKPAVARP